MQKNPNPEISFDLPEHTTVYANIWAVMHDPEHWNNPQDFNPGNRRVGQDVSHLRVTRMTDLKQMCL